MKNFYVRIVAGLAFMASATIGKTQNVAINTTGAAPVNTSVLFDLSNNLTNGTAGFLAPYAALTASNVAAPIAAPSAGLIVYNTATAGASPNNVIPGYYYWDGAKWVLILSGSASQGPAWTILGNAGTNPSASAIGAPITGGSNFLGTTDNKDLVFALNNGANTLERMRIKATNGNIGIANIAPTTMVQIGNAATTVGKLTVYSQDATYGQFQIGNPANNSEASMQFISGVTAFGNPPSSVNGTTNLWNLGAGSYGTGGNKFNLAPFSFGSPVMTWTATGLVGVNTVNPQQNLSVNNGENVDQSNQNNGFLNNGLVTGNGLSFGSGSGEGIASKRTGGGNQFGLDFYTDFINRMSIVNGGNVGIGTNAPAGLLHVMGADWSTGNPVIVQSNGNAGWVGATIRFMMAGGGAHTYDLIGSTGTGAGLGAGAFGVYDNTAGQYRFNISPAGNVGIGTTAPIARLHVVAPGGYGTEPIRAQSNSTFFSGEDAANNARFAINNDAGPLLNFYGSDGGGWFNFMTVNNAGTRVTSFNAGKVGINTVGPTELFDVNGTAGKPGGGVWIAFSDRRMKQQITPYTDGLDKLLQINPVTYHYNNLSGYDTKPQYVGVIAQELKPIAPYMVGTFTKDSVEYYNVDNSAMTYMLVNGVKEQQKMIISQQNSIEELKKENEELRQKLADLSNSVQQLLNKK